MIHLLLLFLLNFGALHAKTFDTLADFAAYASQMPEYPESDTTNWDNPDYSTFHKSLKPSFTEQLAGWFGFGTQHFPITPVIDRLKQVSSYRERVYSRGRLIQKITPEPNSTFIVWGELNGAFHSLVRTLQELEKQRVIDNQLIIQQPLTYFVFNGDVVHRSPYVLETLGLVLLLMERNPRYVIYIKGTQEDKLNWQDGALGRELKVRADHLSTEKMPFSDLFRRFFGTLPLALYLIPPDQLRKEKKVVRISYYGPDTNELDENEFPFFFDVYSKPVISLLQKIPQETEIEPDITAYIYAEDRSKKYTPTQGLALLKKQEDETLWSVLSSPTASFRRLYQFFNDAFVELKTAENLDEWTLTLHHQDVRDKQGFVKEQPFYLLSAVQIKDKQQERITSLQDELLAITQDNESLEEECVLVEKEPGKPASVTPAKPPEVQKVSALQNGNLVIGSTMDLSKQLKQYSEIIKQGINIPIDTINAQGGLDGKKIQMIYLDDGYEPQKARSNIEKFLNEFKTNVVFSTMGTPIAGSYLNLVKDKKVLSIFPHTGSFRDPNLEYMVHLRTSYLENGYEIGAYIAKRLDDRRNKVAFFYQNDAWGNDLLKGAKAEFQKEGFDTFLELPYFPNSLELNKQAKKLVEFDPNAIAFFCSPRICEEFINTLGVDFLHGRELFGDTILGLREFEDYIGQKGIQLTRVQAIPNPTESNLPIVKEFRRDAQKANVPIDTVSLEGYMNAQVFLDLLKKVPGDLTIEKFLDVVENIKDYNFKGLKLNFDPNTRQLLHTVWINTGPGDWEERDIPWHDTIIEEDKKGEPEQIEPVTEGEPLISVHDNVFDIGSTMDLSKGVKSLSTAYKDGITLKMDEINKQGGIHDLRFRFNVLDDGYEPKRTRENVLSLLQEQKIDLLLAPVGTPTFKSYVDLVKEGTFVVLFPSTGSRAFRTPDITHVIHYRPSLAAEAGIITKYIVEGHDSQKVAVFYQDDYFGREANEEIVRLMKEEYKTDTYISLPYQRNDVDFEDQVKKVKDFEPDTIAFAGTTAAVQGFVRQVGTSFLYGKTLYGVSWLMDDALIQFLDDKGLEINLVSVMPNPAISDIPLAQEFRKLAKRHDVRINPTYFEGFFYMSMLGYAVEQTKGTIFKQSILHVFEQMKNFDFKGIKLNFNPETREIAESIWIYTGHDNPWVKMPLNSKQ